MALLWKAELSSAQHPQTLASDPFQHRATSLSESINHNIYLLSARDQGLADFSQGKWGA